MDQGEVGAENNRYRTDSELESENGEFVVESNE